MDNFALNTIIICNEKTFEKKDPKNKKLFLGKIVPLTIPFSNSFCQNLTGIYALKKLLYNEGLADYNDLPLIKTDNRGNLALPNGH